MNDLVSRKAVLDALSKVHWMEVSAEQNSPVGTGFSNVSSINIRCDVDAVRRAIESVEPVSLADVLLTAGWKEEISRNEYEASHCMEKPKLPERFARK